MTNLFLQWARALLSRLTDLIMIAPRYILITMGFVIVCLLFACQESQHTGDTVAALDPYGFEILPGIELPVDGLYGRLSATDDYLIWIEMFDNKVYVYDLEAKEMANIISIPRGEGPGEIEQVFSLTISESNTIYIAGSPNQSRMLKISNIGSDFLFDHIKLSVIPSIVRYCGENIYSLNMHNASQIINEINFSNYSVRLFEENIINMESEFDNLMLKSGTLVCQKDLIFYFTQFIPDIYIYDLKERILTERKTYERVDDMRGRGPFEGPGGGIVHLPPEEVDLRLHEATGFPGDDSSLLLMLEGRGGRFGRYTKDRVYRYNWIENEIIAYTELPAMASSVASNSDTVFMFSDDDYNIYSFSY